ncbi:MAG: NeuD/PglB/VioB family sugar acetyltransferase [Dehalobacterium sp.]
MKNIVIYGSGGMAKELVRLIEDINEVNPTWQIKGYIDDINGANQEVINGYQILGTKEVLKELDRDTYIVLAIADPSAKEKIYQSIAAYNFDFATLIHPTAKIAKNATIGEGSIIGIDCIISVNVIIGRHVFLNMRCVVGHDAVIQDYASCLVNCIIAGNVEINEGAFLGSNCVIMEKKKIGRKAKISMGSVVNFDVADGAVVMSRPSKMMKF